MYVWRNAPEKYLHVAIVATAGRNFDFAVMNLKFLIVNYSISVDRNFG